MTVLLVVFIVHEFQEYLYSLSDLIITKYNGVDSY